MSRKWWDSLTENQKRDHNIRSAVGTSGRVIEMLEGAARWNGSLGSLEMEHLRQVSEGLAKCALDDGLSLETQRRVAELRSRAALLEQAASRPAPTPN